MMEICYHKYEYKIFHPMLSIDSTGGSCRSRTRRRRRQQLLSAESEVAADDSGHEYPLDLWFLLGSYIEPDDISRFARICKGAHAVVHSAMFWHELYKR